LLDLGLEGSKIHVVEAASQAFEGASGYSGGFLASNWYAPNVLPLGELSFALHKELADRHDGFRKWGYAPSTGISLGSPEDDDEEGERAEDWLLEGTSRSAVADRNSRSKADRHDRSIAPKWLRKGLKQRLDTISEGDSTAQV
jgi:glycine/D-amino acid oxidase-like deaminating enzyme